MSKIQYKTVKRIFDIILSTILLTIFSPLLIFTSLLVFVTDFNGIFVKEPLRIGLHGKEFRMFKFRTMVPNAHNILTTNPEYDTLKRKWEQNGNKLKINEDPRITWIGRILRKTDADELPQLINVLKGEMSLVGPRPLYKEELEKHLKSNPSDEGYLSNIFLARPGITGVWQVSGRNEIPLSDRLEIDSGYVKSMNLLDDVKILLKTPYIVLSRKGAYE